MSRQVVSDNIPFGTYVVRVNDGEHAGKYIVNEDHEYLSVTCERSNARLVRQLIDAAKSYGFPNVTLEFREGARQVSQEEYDEQMARMEAGLIPDKYDIGNALDEYRDGPKSK